MSGITRKVFWVAQRETNDVYYKIEAKSSKEALDMFNSDYGEREHTEFVKENKPRIQSVDKFNECPNKGHAWTDIPLADLESGEANPGGRDWHYNGRCKGEKNENDSHCHTCRRAMSSGYRFLTLKERQYLMGRYPGDKPELLVV